MKERTRQTIHILLTKNIDIYSPKWVDTQAPNDNLQDLFWDKAAKMGCGFSSVKTRQQPIELQQPFKTPVFHKFPKLPAELQLMIWNFAAATPLQIDLQISSGSHRPSGWFPSRRRHVCKCCLDEDEHQPPKRFHFISTTPAPSILQVDRTSRFEMLKVYKTLSDPVCSLHGGPFYSNPALDTLYLPHEYKGVPTSYRIDFRLPITST